MRLVRARPARVNAAASITAPTLMPFKHVTTFWPPTFEPHVAEYWRRSLFRDSAANDGRTYFRFTLDCN